MAAADIPWMMRALELAERGRGFVEPNPLVGAVLVRDGRVVGEGWHQRFGQAHAEIHALQAAGSAASGATLYVTLEPCCHHGKTPPCTDAILRSGVRRVVAAMQDPFHAVAGKGRAILEAAQIEVLVGVCEAEARRQNAPYLKLLSTGRPYVHAKWAMTLDGKIATKTGDSKWISGEASRRWVHALRGRMDAIVIGRGTATADDPLLTVRPPGARTPARIVLDHMAQLSIHSNLIKTVAEAPLILVTSIEPEASHLRELRAAGCEVLPLTASDDAAQIPILLDELGRRRFTNIFVEGGAGVLGSFRDAACIDEVHVFVAPKLAGGDKAHTPMGGRGVEHISESLRLEDWRIEQIGDDIVLHARVIPQALDHRQDNEGI